MLTYEQLMKLQSEVEVWGNLSIPELKAWYEGLSKAENRALEFYFGLHVPYIRIHIAWYELKEAISAPFRMLFNRQ